MNHKWAIGFAALAGVVLATQSTAQDWAGGWGGVSLGYGSGSYDQGVTAEREQGPTVDVHGAILGVQVGSNYQNGNTVYGFDASLSQGPNGVTQRFTTGADWSCNSGNCNIDIETLMTIRGRYGMLINPETLAYGAGGLAIGSIDGGIRASAQQGTSTAIGYTLGFGVERLFGENRTLFGELNYVDLGTIDFGTAGPDRYDGVGDFTTFKVGVNFKF